MKKFSFLILFAIAVSNINAQKYFTKEGKVSFFSMAKVEKIEGITNKATSVLDASTGAIEWGVLVKAFRFEKALMQEHFNENYLESSKYPKATFKGKIEDLTALNLSKDGKYTVKVKGNLEMHGVSKPITTTAEFVVKGGKITATSKIKVLLADYKIEIPSLVKDSVAKDIDISMEADYQVLK